MSKFLERTLSALDVIYMRRSVRSYKRCKLDKSTVRALLDAAVQAPTALHLEPWAFVVVQDGSVLKRCSDRAKADWARRADQYRDLHRPGSPPASDAGTFQAQMADPAFNIFYDAGTLIAVCARPLGPFVASDCWLAAENLMLAASAMGLGTCCIGSAVPTLNAPDVKADLGIPADVTVVAPIVVGAPREGVAPSISRRDPEVLAWK